MKHVTMSTHVFNHCGPFQYIAPTIAWLSGWKLDDFVIANLEVTFQLDFERAEYRIQIIDTKSVSVMVDMVTKLPCGETGDQKNIDNVMGLLKDSLKERQWQINSAIGQFTQWFDRQVTKWLVVESERDRHTRFGTQDTSWIVVGD